VEESKFGYWLRRLSAVVAIGLVIGLVIGAYRGSSVIAGELLTPSARERGPESSIELVGAGRIAFARDDSTERPGIWGVSNGSGAYGQMSAVITEDAETIERSFLTITGRFIAGEMVTFDDYAAGTDPMEAYSMEYDNVRVPGALGVNPAWLIRGDRDTWVILIHGEGLDERAQTLRILSTIEEAGFPALVITYRNDSAAPDDGGFYRWGLTEWQDVDAALAFARTRGAEKFVLYGFGMGANIAMMDLHKSDSTGDVLGAVLDSPVLDLGAVVDRIAAERGIPGIISSSAKAVGRLRFGLEWSQLNELDRVDQFDVPMLLIQGAEDDTAPVADADAFAAALPDLVTYEKFAGAGRTEAWNTDAERYKQVVTDFLATVSADAP